MEPSTRSLEHDWTFRVLAVSDRRGSVEDVRSYTEEDVHSYTEEGAHSYTEAAGHVGHSLRVIMTCIRVGSADSSLFTRGSVERFFSWAALHFEARVPGAACN